MTIGIVGVGNMGSIFAEKFSKEAERILLVEKDREKLSRFNAFPYEVADLEKVREADLIVLAVKPQDSHIALSTLKGFDGIFLSIVAGLRIEEIRKYDIQKVARVMPNVAVRVGEGVLAAAFSTDMSLEERNLVKSLLEKLGFVVEIEEKLFSAITALTGSGPAFIFVMVEAFLDAALKMGIPFDTAKKLVYRLFRGSAELLIETDEHPALWKHRVSSPAGTTIEGLITMERFAVRSGVIESLVSSYKRALELEEK
ncbi:pyrroline-5-carboxylate reductase [Thermotoga sp. 38H-to]|uniref:pyrroline-5-carboxylate reductase n=1 Tax=Thermotoga sp. 38H-to TaxID=1755812 RepID=UPI0013EAFDED|nr:pyrroline-5-carboxylate reductase [Thermotoga sp. 38H-to]KAF2959923.1 pyrroline-5-carboxylate reductase [Thermotoga sp. 38H-to]